MPTEIIPVAIYTRKSNDAQLEKEIHSLSVQRNSAEHYITSQSHLGWRLIDEHFDDNNVSGATLERPALHRLKKQIEAGKVKVVVVNRLDRISRSLSQFIELTKYFEAHGVALVSSTQDFNSDGATGDLMRHILLSFAEFEHELIREHAAERLHTARKEGCFTGAQPMLGYNISPYSGKLIIDTKEATRVRQIYELYLKLKSIRGTAKEQTQAGTTNNGSPNRTKPKEAGLFQPMDSTNYSQTKFTSEKSKFKITPSMESTKRLSTTIFSRQCEIL